MLSEQQLYDLHAHYSYNCLTWEQFLQFLATDQDQEIWSIDCEECGKFYPPDSAIDCHRCGCGNRRCYFIAHEEDGPLYFEAAVDPLLNLCISRRLSKIMGTQTIAVSAR